MTSRSDDPTPTEPEVTAGSDGDRHHVLVVEDDDVIRHLLMASLESRGFEVRQASTGFDAYRLVEQEAPDVMIMDVNISLPNSIEVLRHLQLPIRKRQLKIVGLIMPGEADLEERCRALGIRSFLKEPFDLDELGDSVALLLGETD